jgi:hypothetical protein
VSKLKQKTFVEMCIRGEALTEEIDDYIHEWHESKPSIPLHDYLGMTWEEYSIWVGDEEVLPYIVTAHKNNENLVDLLEENYYVLPLAARAGDPFTAKKLMDWLKRQGKLD